MSADRSGLVFNLPEHEYHAGPELSSTAAKRILRSPAHYLWEQQHRVEKATYDFGHTVHALVLGTGLEVVRIRAEDWRTKGAQEQRKEAYAAGKVPLLAKDYARARDTAKAVQDHPVAGLLFTSGQPEVSMFWTDEATGVECRGRIDYLRDGQAIDLKTTSDADPAAFGRTAAKFAYDLQTQWYAEGYHAITGEHVESLHVLVETSAPHGVSVVQLDDEALHIGALKAAQARETYRQCVETGQWPGYPTNVHLVGLPAWAVYELDDDNEMVI